MLSIEPSSVVYFLIIKERDYYKYTTKNIGEALTRRA